MKNLVFVTLTVIGITLISCGSEKKNDENRDSVINSSMSASPGLDTNGVGTDTTSLDTTRIDTTNANQKK